MTSRAAGKVRLLYVGGAGRSGSTLFDRALGQLPGHWSVGELSFLWRASLKRDWPCGCGQPFSKCEFWLEVGRQAFGGWHHIDVDAVRELQHSVDRYQQIPMLAIPRRSSSFQRRLDDYSSLLSQLYLAVRDVSGADVIVDSSKTPATAFLLRQIPELDVYLVHLVRDPHGVVASWSKKGVQNQPGAADVSQTRNTGTMDTWPRRRATRHWMTTNFAFEALARLGVPKVLVRYEDFATEPRRELERVLSMLGDPSTPHGLDFEQDGVLDLKVSHTAAGNPSRFRTGRVPVRLDEAWRQAMPINERRLISAATFPLAKRYGYGT